MKQLEKFRARLGRIECAGLEAGDRLNYDYFACMLVGELKIRELRARAEKALGAKFNLREFHDVILLDSSLPLTVLESRVEEWIENIGE